MTKLDFFFDDTSTVEKLAFSIAHIREVPSSLDALARCSVQVGDNRRKLFRQLSLDGQRVALEEKLQRRFVL